MAYRICFSFHRQLSIWKFMHKPLINVFSKLAIFQGLGPSPHDQEDLQGWPNAFAFLSIVNYQFGNLCPSLWSKFSRNWRCSMATHDQEDLQGWPNAFASLSNVNYQFGNSCPSLWSTFSRNWRHFKAWDQLHMTRRISKGGLTHLLFFLSSIISLEIYAQVFGQRFLETGDVPWPHMIRRISKGDLTHLLFFLSSIINLEIYAQVFGQRFLETGVVSKPGTNSICLGRSPGVV